MSTPIVFFDIAGPDPASQRAFYGGAFGWEVQPTGHVAVPVIASPLPGVLRTDPADKMIYLGVPDVSVSLKEIEALGGQTVAPRFEVPGVVVLGMFTDPAGNRMGLVEMDGPQPRIP